MEKLKYQDEKRVTLLLNFCLNHIYFLYKQDQVLSDLSAAKPYLDIRTYLPKSSLFSILLQKPTTTTIKFKCKIFLSLVEPAS